MINDRIKLSLRRERVRTLTTEQLAGAAGGGVPGRSRFCTDYLCPIGPDGPYSEPSQLRC